MYSFNKSNNLYVNYAVTEESEPVDPFFTDNHANVRKAKHFSSSYPYLFSVNNNESSKIQSKYFLRRSSNVNSNMQNMTPNDKKSQNPYDDSYYTCSTNMSSFPFSELNNSSPYGSSLKKSQSAYPYTRYDRKVKIRDESSYF